MNAFIYVIEKDAAPDLVKAIIGYLAPLDEVAAFHQLNDLLKLTGIDS